MEKEFLEHLESNNFIKSYDDAYSRVRESSSNIFTDRSVSSLLNFTSVSLKKFHHLPLNELNVLEAGCGWGQVTKNLSSYVKNLTAVDFSPVAMKLAQKNLREKKNVNLQCMNICDLEVEDSFDAIIDSHLIHCLLLDEERKKYLKNMASSLKKNGLLVAETMISHHSLNIEDPYYIDSSGILWQRSSQVLSDRPLKRIRSAKEIESELIESGLKVIYFMAYSSKKMIPVSGRPNAVIGDPDVLRFVCRKED